jgi:glucose/arabinose dehydrogenase
MISQDMESAYGKIIEIDTITGSNRIFTSGHRNPQGLHQDSQGRIWSTEHGPQGGDELNLIQFGKNYGWPMISLGTDYGTFSWPVAESSRPEQDFEEPAFAWVPSIGISSLTSIEGGHFQQWRGDLVIGSLMSRSIYRVRIEHDRPVLVEPIAVNERIRDLVRDKNGHIIFWTDSAGIGLLKEASE